MKSDQPSSTIQPAIDGGAGGVDPATVIWRQVFERTDFAIALGDRDGRSLLAVNPAFARMHRRGVDELAGAAIIEVFAPQAREATTEHIRIANGSSHYAWESVHIRADESQFPVQIDVTPIRDDQGNLLFRVVYVQDISGRRRAEQALRESETQLRLTVEAAGVGIFTQRFDGRPSEADDTTLALFGYQPGEWQGDAESFVTRILPEDRPAMERATNQAIPCRSEFRVKRPDGTVRWLMGLRRMEYDALGQPLLMRGVNVDFTDLKCAQIALTELNENLEQRVATRTAEPREATQFNRQVIESAQEGIHVFDPDGRFLLWNPFMEKMSGYPAEHVVGQRAVEIFPFLREGPLEEFLARALQGEVIDSPDLAYDVPETDAKGWNSARFAPLRNVEQEIIGVIVTTRDITERKYTEGALRAAQQRLEMLLSCVAAVIYSAQARGGHRATFISDNVRQVMGYDAQQFIDDANFWLDRVHPDDRLRRLATFQAAMDSGADVVVEYRFRAADGEYRWIHDEARPIRSDNGSVLEFIGYWVDISQRKRTEQQMKAHQAEKEKLQQRLLMSHTVAAVAHELNQPLNAVVTYSEAALRLLRAGNLQPEKLNDALEKSVEQAQRAGQTMRGFLAFLHAQETAPEVMDLVEAVRRAIQGFTAEDCAGFAVTMDAALDLPAVRAVPLHVEKVLLNLLRNAVEATRRRGLGLEKITISIQPAAEERFLQVSVRDFGPGLDPKVAREMLEPFYMAQVHAEGVGLSVSRSIIEAQGGHLWVDADARPGARFHFTLPCVP